MKNSILILGVMILLSLNLISAVPPFIQGQTGNGYNIKIQEIGTLEQDANFSFNFHVFNASNGVPIDNSSTSCYFHLYQPNGIQILETQPSSTILTSNVVNEWELNVLGGNFSSSGNYASTIQCNSTEFGGFISFGIEVTQNGQDFSTGKAVSYLGFIFVLLLTLTLTLFGGYLVPWKHEKDKEDKIISVNNFRYLKVFFFSMAYLEVMFLFGLSYKFFNEANIQGFPEFFNFIYQLMLNFMYPLIVALVIIFFAIWINNKKLSKNLKLGLH